MATLPPADAPASGRSLRTRRTDTGADREADGQFAVTLGPDGPIDPHAATLRPSDHIDPYAETLSPSRKSAALADTMAPEDPATGSTLGPESAASLREHSLDGVVSVGDMSRLHSEYPVVRWDRYEFQKKLGQGGMGAVYKARDRRLGRDVALKFIRGGDPNMVMRFLQEARAQARIDHPHVCKVYEVGEVEGKAYIAMQYVDGHSLNRAAKDLSLTEKVLLMRQVAEAMHEAHRLGIIHRDLKPDNIMVERLTDGTLSPVVMDFGLARESGDNRGLTESGAVMGTPAYMAPEQARGDVRTLDRRADVYSLGATLYDLVAGSPPFDAESIVDVLMQVMNEDAVPLRNRLPSVPSDLETIVMKCLRKEPGARYDSAKALADDLQRYIDGEPIQGRRESVIGRVRRRAKKNLALVFVSAGSLVLVVSFAVQWIRVQLAASRERARAAELVKLERQLGQDIKEMEWFLRSAYQLPLHDITPQLAIVRTRMAAMETQRAALRGDDGGRIDYAIGRGHLALHEPTEALRYLKAAKQRGLDIPELHYALGRALGERFQQALEEARRQGDKSWLEKRRKELEAQYLVPAVAELELSRGASLDSPAYLEGLIAFYRKQYDLALAKAQTASNTSPWLYEASQLEGDVLLENGTQQCDAGKYDAGIVFIDKAIVAARRAADISRSDSRTYANLASYYVRRSGIQFEQRKDQKPDLRHVMETAQNALASNPRLHVSQYYLAYANFWLGFMSGMASQNPEKEFTQAIKHAKLAIGLEPKDARSYDMMGNSYFWLGAYQKDHGSDPLTLWSASETAFRQALALDNEFPWAHSDLGLLLQGRGSYLEQRGESANAEFEKSIESFERAIRADALCLPAYINILETYYFLIDAMIVHGKDPAPYVKRAEEIFASAVAINQNVPILYYNIANSVSAQAVYVSNKGTDPTEFIERAERYNESLRKIDSDGFFPELLSLRLALAWLIFKMHSTEDVRGYLTKMRVMMERCRAKKESFGGCESIVADGLMHLANANLERSQDASAYLQEAIELSRKCLTIFPENLDGLRILVEATLRGRQHSRKPVSLAQLDQDLQLAQKAYRGQRGGGRNAANLASLYLLRAQRSPAGTPREKDLQESQRLFREAVALNPLLGKKYARETKELAELLGALEGRGGK